MLLDKAAAIRRIETERDIAIAVAHANFERQRDLIEKLWSPSQETEAAATQMREVKPVQPALMGFEATESLSKRVLKIIAKFDHEFTVDELMLALNLDPRGANRNAVVTALGRASEDGIVRRTQRGSRKQAAIYKVTTKGVEQAKKAVDGLLPIH